MKWEETRAPLLDCTARMPLIKSSRRHQANALLLSLLALRLSWPRSCCGEPGEASRAVLRFRRKDGGEATASP